MAKSAKKETAVFDVQEIHTSEAHLNILGRTPMIMHRFSSKAWHELLLPSKQQNRASLESKLKHNPPEEFREAIYMNRDEKAAAAIHVPNGSFAKAIAAAALDIPGAKKAQIERLTGVVDMNINLFGVPRLLFSMVRNSDMARTPDVRTRPIFPEWACTITVQFVRPQLTERTMVHLAGAAGKIVGIGDWRPQKGGPYGRFELVDDNNAEFKRIVKTQARQAQLAAIKNPVAFDEDSEELLAWFEQEVIRRESDYADNKKPVAVKAKGKKGKEIPVIVENGDGQFVGLE